MNPAGRSHSFAVNLESQPADYTPEALQLARDRLKVPVFVSQAVVDGVSWFRLRAGPFEKRADAERILARGWWITRAPGSRLGMMPSPAAVRAKNCPPSSPLEQIRHFPPRTWPH